MMPSKLLLIGLLSLFLPACATLSPPEKLVFALPPASLLADCPAPPADLRTNADLARYAAELQTALATCNGDKAALRAWAEGAK